MKMSREDIARHAEAIDAGMRAAGLDAPKIDLALIAEIQNDDSRYVDGWSAPRVLPPDWREIERDDKGNAKYFNAQRRLGAILSCLIEEDNCPWLHLSVSHRERIPTHGEMRTVKELFLGDRYAYAVWPPKARYINLHPNVLHLFALLEARSKQPLPDFTWGTGSL